MWECNHNYGVSCGWVEFMQHWAVTWSVAWLGVLGPAIPPKMGLYHIKYTSVYVVFVTGHPVDFWPDLPCINNKAKKQKQPQRALIFYKTILGTAYHRPLQAVWFVWLIFPSLTKLLYAILTSMCIITLIILLHTF